MPPNPSPVNKLVGSGDITDTPTTSYTLLCEDLHILGYYPLLQYQGTYNAKTSQGGFLCTLMNNVLLGTTPSGRGPTEVAALRGANAMRILMEDDPRYQYKGIKTR